jgi:hypothetical protein
MGEDGDDGLDASQEGLVYEVARDDCPRAGFEEGISEGAGIGDADADLFHQPRGKRTKSVAAKGAGEGEGVVVRADSTSKEEGGVNPAVSS